MLDIEIPDVLTSDDVPGMRAAELVVDGLSVFCFNKFDPKEPFWEVAYPRQGGHTLKITIQELDGDGNKVGTEQSHPVHRQVHQLFIRLTNGSLEHYQQDQFPEGGPKRDGFTRNLQNDDPNDLQWMLDLAGNEIRHGQFLGLKPRHADRPRTVAIVHHSLFCNLEPEDFPPRISPRHTDDPNGNGNFDLPGPTNTLIVGVLLGTAAGEIQFAFIPPLTTIASLEYNPDKRYRIEIRNEDDQHQPHRGKFIKGDLGRFYDELIEVSGEQKDLWAIPSPDKHAVSPDGDCHPTIIGGGRTLLP
jgi:hypothetical protein